MANTDDKPALKITLEDLARVELPAQAARWQHGARSRRQPDSMATLLPLLTALRS